MKLFVTILIGFLAVTAISCRVISEDLFTVDSDELVKGLTFDNSSDSYQERLECIRRGVLAVGERNQEIYGWAKELSQIIQYAQDAIASCNREAACIEEVNEELRTEVIRLIRELRDLDNGYTYLLEIVGAIRQCYEEHPSVNFDVPEDFPMVSEDLETLQFPEFPTVSEDLEALQFPEFPLVSENLEALEFPEFPLVSEDLEALQNEE